MISTTNNIHSRQLHTLPCKEATIWTWIPLLVHPVGSMIMDLTSLLLHLTSWLLTLLPLLSLGFLTRTSPTLLPPISGTCLSIHIFILS